MHGGVPCPISVATGINICTLVFSVKTFLISAVIMIYIILNQGVHSVNSTDFQWSPEHNIIIQNIHTVKIQHYRTTTTLQYLTIYMHNKNIYDNIS